MVVSAQSPQKLLIVTSRFAGERVLVRLLSASGIVHCSGDILNHNVPDPVLHVSRTLSATHVGGKVRAAILHPDDIWVHNSIADPDAFFRQLSADGVKLITLCRRSHSDRGLSHALCGSMEVLPLSPKYVDPLEVMVYARDSERIERWIKALSAFVTELIFEDHLGDEASQEETLNGLGSLLDLPLSSPPVPQWQVPSHQTLWDLVDNKKHVEEILAAPSPFRHDDSDFGSI